MLEQKIKEMDQKNKEDKRRMREIIEGNIMNINPPPSKPQNLTTAGNNSNPATLEQAMNNIRNQNDGMMDFAQKQAMRRQQIQFELNQARDKLKNDRFFNGERSSTNSSEEEEEEEEESDKLLNPDRGAGGLLGLTTRPEENKTKTSKMNKTAKKDDAKKDDDGKELNSAEEEANEFIHNIPDHVALKLQADNFRVRANFAQVKD